VVAGYCCWWGDKIFRASPVANASSDVVLINRIKPRRELIPKGERENQPIHQSNPGQLKK